MGFIMATGKKGLDFHNILQAALKFIRACLADKIEKFGAQVNV